MINTTKGHAVFIETGKCLNDSIVAALRLASGWVLKAYGLEKLDLGKVNTKSYKEAIFPAYVDESILRNGDVVFTEDYIRDSFELVSGQSGDCSPALYFRLTMNEGTPGKRDYRKSYLPSLRRGFGAFLVALHVRRAIVLPFSFRWPIGLELGPKGIVLRRREICPPAELPELLALLRLLNSQSDEQTEVVFNGYTPRSREALFTLGQRLIIAAGWLTPEDANYEDLLALWTANEKTHFSGNENLSCLLLADFLERKYQSRSPIDGAGWRIAISRASMLRRGAINELSTSKLDDASVLEQALSVIPSRMAPEELAQMTSLPGLDFDLAEQAKTWLTLERTWLKKVKRESNKGRLSAIGHLNVYLFAYLPYWLDTHPTFAYPFPDTPKGLLSAVFVSDIGVLDHQHKPVTLVDFLAATAVNRKWGNSTHYGYIKQIEKLFEFVERFGAQIPGCTGFKQPLSEHDYPHLTRSYGTNKRPIPRRIFKFWLEYIEEILAHSNALLTRILAGEVSDIAVGGLLQNKRAILDCVELRDLFGYVPVVFHKGKAITLRHIPNVLFLEKKHLKDGRLIHIPHPHALHQILVALYTGLRHNHIQWLDAKTFDRRVDDVSIKTGFARLHVNTDKSKAAAWQSHVNIRVIELLREQLSWRQTIDESGFSNKQYYNNHRDSKWGQFVPLFSYYSDGKPHADHIYAAAWTRLLTGVQGMLRDVGEPKLKLVRLLPSTVPFDDPDLVRHLYEYGSQQKRYCEVIPKSNITPHSARVSVVSHAISILPADVIGRNWTGQTAATVAHYVVPDEDETFAEQQRQNLMLRQRGYEIGYEAMLAAAPGQTSPFIKADDVNSNLSKSLSANVEETLAAYGCVSLSLNGSVKTGLDIIRETRAIGAVANKTEICPYGNSCPTEVIVQYKGFRRCGPCHFAVRSIDHLPAITAKIRQVSEGLEEVERRLAAEEACETLTPREFDELADNRNQLSDDITAWVLASEVLEAMRHRLSIGISTTKWHIQKPEIIERDLRRVLFPTGTTEYVLARLVESEAFPTLSSPQINSKYDLMRRNLLAKVGNVREALSMKQPSSPAAECLGLIRSVVSANQLSIDDLKCMLESDEIMEAIPSRKLHLLPADKSQ